MRFIFTLILLSNVLLVIGQSTPQNGMKPSEAHVIVIENVTIQLTPEKQLTNASILIECGVITDIGKTVKIPDGALRLDYSGKYLVASFIELNSQLGIANLKKEASLTPQFLSSKEKQFDWNQAVHPEFESVMEYKSDTKKNRSYLELGFGLVQSHLQDGIFRGTGCLSSPYLDPNKNNIVKTQTGQFLSFYKGSSSEEYPTSQAGSIALIRQTFYDMEWYQFHNKSSNVSYDALIRQKALPWFFHVKDDLEIARAAKIAKEFGWKFTYIGTGEEYQSLPSLKESNSQVVIPIDFPNPYETSDPYLLMQADIVDLKHWELAASNPYFLQEQGVTFAISAAGINTYQQFWKNLHKAIERGLSYKNAIASLTTVPANMLGIDKEFGTLEKGKRAFFSVYSSDPFKTDAVLLENWLGGDKEQITELKDESISGAYNISLDGKLYPIEIQVTDGVYNGKIKLQGSDIPKDSLWQKFPVKIVGLDINFETVLKDQFYKGNISFKGKFNSKLGVLEGKVLLPDGKLANWSGVKNTNLAAERKVNLYEQKDTTYSNRIWYPMQAYGATSSTKKVNSYVLKNATIWTNESIPVIQNGTVWIRDGKIAYVGKDTLHSHKAEVINLNGKVLTCGIIDEHSHIALSNGVNEEGHVISAQVSMADVIDPTDISIYRQLAGGVTAAQLLHGSANPIGGQSALIKLKWGSSADKYPVPNSPKFIKFALGENVKQANWGDQYVLRFPQTRMGVEQLLVDAFTRAENYNKEWKEHHTKISGKHHNYKHLPRRDLELDVLVEILEGQRNITCHSYVQSEINMLMHVADSFGFRVNTFTHILEGYKLADKMKAHGVGGSTFSDWWAYKYEVKDAIPYNATLMSEQGVLVAINSDDAEMGRRLNQEAAKSIKYGGMNKFDAWKMVTLNPAKLLHLDTRMGSVRKGKDADLVIWSDEPTSIYAIPLFTFVDGELLYQYDKQDEFQIKLAEERGRLITKMKNEKENGSAVQPIKVKKERHFHCNTSGQVGSEGANEH